MRQDVNDSFLLMIDEYELVVIPAGCKEFIVFILNDPVNELLSFV